MVFREPLSKVVLKGVKHFREGAELASTAEEKLSLLLCANKSAELSEKLVSLEQRHTGMSLFRALEALPECKVLRAERLKRYRLQQKQHTNL